MYACASKCETLQMYMHWSCTSVIPTVTVWNLRTFFCRKAGNEACVCVYVCVFIISLIKPSTNTHTKRVPYCTTMSKWTTACPPISFTIFTTHLKFSPYASRDGEIWHLFTKYEYMQRRQLSWYHVICFTSTL